jgi:hypothetical protein
VSLTVETGDGVQGADSYAAVATITAYWTARGHSAFAQAWLAASAQAQDGAAREASTYLDATWGPFYRGVRQGYVQGLLWPRSDTKDEAGYPLPPLPPELVAAACELAGRAVTARLAPDIDLGARVKAETKKVGPIEKTTTYADAGPAPPTTSYGFVAGLLAPILNGAQPNAPLSSWGWA